MGQYRLAGQRTKEQPSSGKVDCELRGKSWEPVCRDSSALAGRQAQSYSGSRYEDIGSALPAAHDHSHERPSFRDATFHTLPSIA